MKIVCSFFSLLVLLFLVSSCSSYSYLTLPIIEPAAIPLANFTDSIGIINRATPIKEKVSFSQIEQFLTLEGDSIDVQGNRQLLNGLKDDLETTARFTAKVVEAKNVVQSSGINVLPPPISWTDVEQICKTNNLDCLIEVSYYDTDTKINYSSANKEVNNPLGGTINVPEHKATVTTNVKVGYRVYELDTRLLRDEYKREFAFNTIGKGINPVKALQALKSRKEQALRYSYELGENYASYFIPRRVTVKRNYYVRGTERFEIAQRRAQTGNWTGAAQLWALEVDNAKAKIAGRACYNMAIAAEIDGDLDKAIEWASKAYTDYKDKFALNYVKVLRKRQKDNARI